uniref:Uma2 family endonuclease n=2 Tax=unclassified Picosynechococcus TaxID=3079910 RepID=UPI000A6BDA11|nr:MULTISPECIES: Uma2 family endonuclease [unclassified Picosynechococcus]
MGGWQWAIAPEDIDYTKNINTPRKTMVANAVRWTVQDLEAMPDDGGWKRYEIIDGELIVTRAPHIFHQSAASRLHIALGNWSDQSGLGRVFEAPGVVFSPNDGVIPDVVWVSNARLETGVDESGHFTVAPELMIEILSAGKLNEQRDKEAKRKLYSLYGVQEYWVVDWRLKTIEVYRRNQAQLELVCTLLGDDALTSPLLPDFTIAIDQVFR